MLKGISNDFLVSVAANWTGAEATTNLQLVKSLQTAGLLKTVQVVSAFQELDRASFTSDPSPYENRPKSIGVGEVLTSPSSHAVSLEILYPYFANSKKILDIGCGTGFITQALGLLAPQSKVIGIDIHKNLIETAMKIPSRNKNVEFKRCDIREIFEYEFDIINVGFGIANTHTSNLKEKLTELGVLLCPTIENERMELELHSSKETLMKFGEVAYSQMREMEEYDKQLEEVEAQIKLIYNSIQTKLGRNPSISDLPDSLQPLLKERRKLLSKLKYLSKP